MRISATNWSLMRSPLRLARENPGQGDDEVDAQERLHVVVRLAATHRRDGVGVHGAGGCVVDVRRYVERVGRQVAARGDLTPGYVRRGQRMPVVGNCLSS